MAGVNWPYILEMLADNVWSVVVAVAPLALLFLVFQALLLKLPPRKWPEYSSERYLLRRASFSS